MPPNVTLLNHALKIVMLNSENVILDLFQNLFGAGLFQHLYLCDNASFFLSFIPQSLAQTTGRIAPGQAEV
jgi:hypothetical protein